MAQHQQAAETHRRVELSVVIPVYGCADTLLPLHQRLTAAVKGLVASYEIVFVDDRARDGAWAVLERLAASDPCVIAIRMSRNVGQQLAITAGLAECCGDRVVVMDCDLQDPPGIIPVLYARAQEGFDIVLAKRRSGHRPISRLIANRVYFALLGFVAGHRFDGELGTFSIVSRRVIDAFLQFSERDRHYLMILHAVGFESSTIEYDRDVRHAGRSGYTLRKLLAHALSGLFFSTTRLLYWVIYAGGILAGSGILLAFALVLRWFAEGAMPGWTSLIVVQLLVGGVIALCVGVTGLYVGRILEEAQRRPLYFLQDRLDGRALSNARVRPLQRVGEP
jgi:polyisoprenyl-phosphate glycosyltransferase